MALPPLKVRFTRAGTGRAERSNNALSAINGKNHSNGMIFVLVDVRGE